jgi:hypothetical protein
LIKKDEKILFQKSKAWGVANWEFLKK